MRSNYSILRSKDKESLDDYIDLMKALSPDIMGRKHPQAVYQQAWCLREAVQEIDALLKIRGRVHVVIIGVLDDPIYPCLQQLYPDTLDLIICDPVVNRKTSRDLVSEGIIGDIVIACSVWEHDPDVSGFLKDLIDLSRSAIILTADFHPNYYGKNIPSTSFRILDEHTLLACLKANHVDIESGDLSCTDEDLFCWEGCFYYFLKMVIK